MGWQNEFPQAEELIYLNHAAVSPWPLRTQEAVTRFARENVTHGAANYATWLKTEQQLRQRLQHLINAYSCDDIALQKNTSEALSVIAYGLAWQPGDNVVISNQEFPSNRIVWESLARLGVEVRVANLDAEGDPEQAVIEQFDKRTRLLSISSVQYASGLKMDCVKLGAACKSHGVLFCIDAIQSIGAQTFDVQAYQADFVVADGHKWMLGPEGLALFYSTPEARDQLQLHQFGWHMVKHRGKYDRLDWEIAANAQRFECGSPNMLGAYALNASLSLLEEVGMETVATQVHQHTRHLIERLSQISAIKIISPTDERRYAGIVTFKHGAISTKQLFEKLIANNIICAHRGGGIRFSPHFYTPTEKLDNVLNLLH